MRAKAREMMVMRHAEKPNGRFSGVKETGDSNPHDLSVRGWQRAGALACLFAPAHGPLQDALLARPAFIFASAAHPTLILATRGAGARRTRLRRLLS